jgi:hypothetical protein
MERLVAFLADPSPSNLQLDQDNVLAILETADYLG